MNILTPEKIRFQALSLRLRADEARAESQAADAALAKAGELAKVAKVAAKETEEAAQEAELKALKLPGGLHGEPSPLAVEVLSGSHGEDAVECVAQVCTSMLNPEWLLLALSCKHIKTGFESLLHALRERQETVLSMCLKVRMTLLSVVRAHNLEWGSKQLTHSGMLAFSYLASNGSMRSLKILDLRNNQIGDAGMIVFSSQIPMMGNLTLLWLQSNQIADEGMKALASVIASGSLRNLTQLGLSRNQIGNAGITEFSHQISSGLLRALEWLDLSETQIGDAGMSDFSRQIAIGSLPSLRMLGMDDGPLGNEHPQLKAVCEARGIDLS